MRINNNVMALNAHRQLGINQGGAAKSMEKLSSGFRINRAGDDAAGLAISEKMRGQIRGLKQASRNAQDGISLIQTAEGALNETHSILQRMRELANQAATDTNTLTDRKEIQKEINQLLEEIDRVGNQTEFNTQALLDGTYTNKKLHIGANENQNMNVGIASMKTDAIGDNGIQATATLGGVDFAAVAAKEDGNGVTIAFTAPDSGGSTLGVTVSGSTITVQLGGTDASTITSTTAQIAALINGHADASKLVTASVATPAVAVAAGSATTAGGAKTGGGQINVLKVADVDSMDEASLASATNVGVLTQSGANQAITNVNNAIEQVSAERSKLGAVQNRLEHTIANLGTSAENLQAAESRIRDLDMAEEIMAFTKNNILQQAATAMLAQANMAPQSVLQLLG